MPAGSKFNATVKELAEGAFLCAVDNLKVMLTNTLPVATNTLYGDISAGEVANGNGYTTGGTQATLVTSAQSSGTYTLTLNNVVFTATGAMGPFRYAVLYDSTTTSPLKPLLGWWDYGSSLTLQNTDTWTVAWNGGGSSGSVFTLV